jgi:hypothetical protein
MRSLADKGWEKPQAPEFSPLRGLLVVIGLVWLLATLLLLNYYWENSGLKEESGPNPSADGHYLLGNAEAQSYGLGLSARGPGNGTDLGIGELLSLRQAQKSGSSQEQAQALQRIRQDIQTQDNEAYRTLWAPVLACAQKGCENSVYMQTAAGLAARQPRWAGHAMILEANYWRQAKEEGDPVGGAAAVAKLDKLVRGYGSTELKSRWAALDGCDSTCPVFEELVLGFVGEAVKN